MQSNAVAQFEAWSREESAFRTATAKADRERQHLEGVVTQLRQQQKKLSHDTRESSDLLGRFHRQCGLLQQEKDRLLRQLKEERTLLEQCARDTEELVLQETTAKKLFCKEVESLNGELAEYLSKQEDRFFQKMMSIETVSTLQEFFLKSVEKEELQSDSINLFMKSLKGWIDAATASENLNQDLMLLKDDVDKLRSHAFGIVAKENKGVPTESVLDDMERSWEVGDGKEEPKDVSFCYGETDTSQDDSMVD